MNFDQLKTFISVANTGSYSLAAKQRFVSQPAISNQMKTLEEELDTTLFIRNQKNLSLTEKGQMFYKYATQLTAMEKDALNSIKGTQGLHYGMLDIGAPYLTMYELLDNFFVKCIQQYGKKVTLRVLQREDTDIPQMVLNGELEIGVCNHMLEYKNLVYEKAFVEEIALITPNAEKYRNLDKKQLRALLLKEKHIRYDFGSGSDFLWNDFFGKIIGEELHNIRTGARTSQYTHQLAAVESGLGIGFISNICMQKKWREGKILAYRCKGLLEKPHYVVYEKERASSSGLIRSVKELLRQELNKSIKNPEESF